jgi:CheY-like chemotaxis protein
MTPPAASGCRASGDAKTSWILVVDDDQDIRDTLLDVLADAGYSVRVAADGSEALEVLGHGDLPSLILLDLMMPGMDGFAFRQAQASDPRLASVPVVIVSASANLARDAKRLGATGYIQKPMRLDAVLREVESRCA